MNSQLHTEEVFEVLDEKFQSDVLSGMQHVPKKLSSKYFYDKTGDRLFQEIMAMPEYYLTDCELDIFENKTQELAKSIVSSDEPFDLIELGAGDAMKSTYLLQYLVENKIDFTYMPIDISGNILSILNEKLNVQLPNLKINLLEGEYFDMLEKATAVSNKRKVVLFLGGNIGNMQMNEAKQFCRGLKNKLNPGDLFLVGFDLKKNPHIILNAYNDSTGITAAFNLNLLTRINRELYANFNVKKFTHYQTYDPVSGSCRSFLVSLCRQKVTIGNNIFDFDEHELIDMEISQKFSEKEIIQMAEDAGFQLKAEIKDSKNWFVDSIWQA